MCRRSSLTNKISNVFFTFIFCLSQLLAICPEAYSADDYDIFTQEDWQAGLSSASALHPVNMTGWDRYSAITPTINASSVGQISLLADNYLVGEDTDSDFNDGVFSNTEVSGAGVPATVGIKTDYEDVFFDEIGDWSALPFAPYMGENSPMARAGNYIYSIWLCNDANRSFLRWSIADEEWEVLAQLPESAGNGAALAYDGDDTIYTLLGGRRRAFYAYTISTNTWEQKTDSLSVVSAGAALVYVPSDPDVLYAFCGGGTTTFLQYRIATDSWSTKSSAFGDIGGGSSLILSPYYQTPGQEYLYATRGNDSKGLIRYNYLTDTWGILADSPRVLNRLGGMTYPGSGAYLYTYQPDARWFGRYHMPTNTWQSSWYGYVSGLPKNIEMTSLPFAISGRGYMYDDNPQGPSAEPNELKFLSNHTYSGVYHYYPTTKKWKEESDVPVNPYYMASSVYVDVENAVYYLSNSNSRFYKYHLDFYPAAANDSMVSHQWERMSDIIFAGNTKYAQHGGGMVYKPGDNYIYCLQGNDEDGFSRFNLTSKAWEVLSPLSQKARYGGLITISGNYVYAAGGYDDDLEIYTKDFFRYDPANNTWEKISECPFGSFNWGARAVPYCPGDYLYMFFAYGGGAFCRYHVPTDSWENLASVPVGYLGNEKTLTYNSARNSIYMLDAGDFSSYGGFFRYDIDSNGWTLDDFLIFQGSMACSTGDDNNLYYIGNRDTGGLRTYDFASDQWDNRQVGASYNNTKYAAGGVARVGDYVYVVMNRRSGYAWKYSVIDNKWVDLIKLPFTVLSDGARITYPGSGDYIYLVRGDFTREFWRYDVVNEVFSRRADCPDAFSWGARLTADESGVYTKPLDIGGFYRFNDDDFGGSWLTLATPPMDGWYEGNGICIIGDSLIASNGLPYAYKGIYFVVGWDNFFLKYDIDSDTWSYLGQLPWAVDDSVSLLYPDQGDYLYCTKGGGREFARYNLGTNTWDLLSDLPTNASSRGSDGYVRADQPDVIYFTSGGAHGKFGMNFNRYSISENRWDEPSIFPVEAGSGTGIAQMPSSDDIFYLRGGNSAYKYNTISQVWYTLADVPASIGDDAKVIYPGTGDYIYLTGGSGRYDFLRYHDNTDSWVNLPNPPATFNSGQAVAYCNNYIYVLRGGGSLTFWRYSIVNQNWTQLNDAPAPVSTGANLVYPGYGNYLYGAAGGGSLAFWRYDTQAGNWSAVNPLPMASSQGSIFTPGFGDYFYYFPTGDTPFCYRYSISAQDDGDPLTKPWQAMEDLPFSVSYQANAVYPGKGDFVYLSTGKGTSSLMKQLMFSSGTYTSNVKEIGNNVGFGDIDWSENGLGDIEVKVRSGNNASLSDGLAWGYVDSVSEGSDISDYRGINDEDKYLQYRLRFFCYDSEEVPRFDNVSVEYQEYPLEGQLTSSAYNTTDDSARVKQISWNADTPEGTDVRFQLRTSPDGENWTAWLGPDGVQDIPYEFGSSGEYANLSEIVVEDGGATLSRVLEDYLYRQTIIVDNSAGVLRVEDTTINIKIPRSNADFWDHISSEGSDIRFVDSDGQTPLPYRVIGFDKEEKTALCRVTLSSIPAATKNIYILYGKAYAMSESNQLLGDSLIGIEFYALMSGFLEIITTEAPNTVTVEKLNNDGVVISTQTLDFISVGEKQRYNDDDFVTYRITAQKPITVFSSACEPQHAWDSAFYYAGGQDLWAWCPSLNYDGDVYITAYEDNTVVKITDYNNGDDTTTINLDKGNFWNGKNKVDGNGEVWHVEATKPITFMAGYLNYYGTSQVVSPDMKEYYFYLCDGLVHLAGLEDNTNFTIDNLDGDQGDYSGTINNGEFYLHEFTEDVGISARIHIKADKPITLTASDFYYGGMSSYLSADNLERVGKEYSVGCGLNRSLYLVSLEDGANVIEVTGDVTQTVNLATKGSKASVDLGGYRRAIQLTGTRNFALYVYNSSSNGLTPVYRTTELANEIPARMRVLQEAATSSNPQMSAWQYKESMSINNVNEEAFVDFQIPVDINKNHLGFWQNCRVDGADVRFIDSDDSSLLSYYQEYFDYDNQEARFWVKVPDLSNLSNKTIYLYYGNAAAASLSSGSDVFTFFDDFDSDLDQWQQSNSQLAEISSITIFESEPFSVDPGTSQAETIAILPVGLDSTHTYQWHWKLLWPNGSLVEHEPESRPFEARNGLFTMSDGPFMVKTVVPDQVVTGLGGTFTNDYVEELPSRRFKFSFTDVVTEQVFQDVYTEFFDIPVGVTTINNLTITIPSDMILGRLYSVSWRLEDGAGSRIIGSGHVSPLLFNVACGFELVGVPTLPTHPLEPGVERQITADFDNNVGAAVNNLRWRLTLVDVTPGAGRSAVKVGYAGYIRALNSLSPNDKLTTQVTWQVPEPEKRFFGVGDPNARYASELGDAQYLAGYNILLGSSNNYAAESGSGTGNWQLSKGTYASASWNTDLMTWWPHDPANGNNGKMIYKFSDGQRLTYNAGFVPSAGFAIAPIVRAARGPIYIDKFLVYKAAAIAPYVGFTFNEIANPNGMGVYYTSNPVIQPIFGVFYDVDHNLSQFQDSKTTPANTDVRYQVSSDGYNWYWHNGGAWEKITGGYSQTNSALEINLGINDYTTLFSEGEFLYRAFLNSVDGVNAPVLDRVNVTTVGDPTFYLDPAGNDILYLNSDTFSDQWFQYKTMLNSLGQKTPILSDISIEYLGAYIIVTSPNGGEAVPIGQQYEITWNEQGINSEESTVTIEYSTDSGVTWAEITNDEINDGAYLWDVPDQAAHQSRIRVTSNEFPTVSDSSDDDFGIMGLILTSPNGSEFWEIGATHNITWSSHGGTVSEWKMQLDYSFDNGATWNLIADQQNDDGTFEWNIAQDEGIVSEQCLVRISDTDHPEIYDLTDAIFSLEVKPDITVDFPNGGGSWRIGSQQDVTWSNKGRIYDSVDILYSINSGISWEVLAEDVSNIESASVIAPDVFTKKARIRVQESEVPENRDTTTIVFDSSNSDFEIVPPLLVLTSPNGNEMWVKGDTESIVWTSDGTISNNLKIEYSLDQGVTWMLIAEDEDNDGSYDWLIPAGAVGGEVLVRVTDTTTEGSANPVYDGSNNPFAIYDRAFVQLQAPNGGEETTMGAPYEVKWFSVGLQLEAPNEVFDFYISYDSGQSWEATPVVEQQYNDGEYSWRPPQMRSDTVRLKIKCHNGEDFPWVEDESNADFSILEPKINITYPTEDESWYATGTYTITWESLGAIGENRLRLMFSLDGGANYNEIASDLADSGTYTWSPIVNALTDQFRLKLYDASRIEVEAISGDNSIIAPTITINTPNGGESWIVGEEYLIEWETEGTNNSIRDSLVVEYSSDGGSSWNLIANELEQSVTSYNWTIPADISDDCLVQVYDSTRTTTKDQSDEVFSIAPPTIGIISPTPGDIFPYGSVQQVKWEAVGQVSDDVSIWYSSQGGLPDTWSLIHNGATVDRTFEWTVPDDRSATCKIKIRDNEIPNTEVVMGSVFSITYPVIAVTRPNGGEIFAATDKEAINWDNSGSVGATVKIEYSKDNFITDVNQIIGAEVVANSGEQGSYLWTVPEDLSTTVRVRVTDNETSQITDRSNNGFSILPFPVITLNSPNGGEKWRIGTIHDITWEDNAGPVSNNLKLEYSNDGGASWKLIEDGVANSGTYEWIVADDYSVAASVRISDNQRETTVDSSDEVFTIELPAINITSPISETVWAVGDQAQLGWSCEGAVNPDNLLLQYSVDNFNTAVNIEAGVSNTGIYSWTVPNEPTNNMKIRIIDGDRPLVSSDSESFNILTLPQITVDAPDGDEEYVIGNSMEIAWETRGLGIEPLTIIYSADDFISTETIASDVSVNIVNQNGLNNGTYTWNIPNDALASRSLKVRIYDSTRPVITDDSDDDFRIRGGFSFTAPATAGEDWIVFQDRNITWNTLGTISNVRLDYRVDGGEWINIVTSIANSGTYTWRVPDVPDSGVELRVSDPSDTTVFAMSETVSVRYYAITWRILDYDNMEHLQNLSVSDTWWQDNSATLVSPTEHKYPAGRYTTFWAKDEYIERSEDWIADSDKTVTVLLENKISAQIEWHVLTSSSYTAGSDSLSMSCWLERRGKLVGLNEIERADLNAAQIEIYDGTTLVHTMNSNAADARGVFWFNWADTGLQGGKTYFTRATITFREREYNSGSSVDVTIAKEHLKEQEQLDDIASSQEDLSVQTAQAKTSIENKVDSAKDSIETTISEAKESIKSEVSTVKSDTEDILVATEKTIPEQVEQTRQEVETARKSQILNRESVVRMNEKLTIRYRTYSGLAPVVDIYDAGNTKRVSRAAMSEIGTTGVYEYRVRFISVWGYGDFTIVCSESSKGTLDAMIISVLQTDLEQIAGQVSAVLGSTSGINDLKSVASILQTQFTVVETAIENLGREISGGGQEAIEAMVSGKMKSIYGQLSEISSTVRKLSGNQEVSLEMLYTVSEKKAQDLTYLKNKAQELKAAVEINKKIMKGMNTKPVTQTWYEYR